MKVDAKKAFELMYELLKEKPWLNSGGTMTPDDASSEQEALVFLLRLDTADSFGQCSKPARRVVNSLLLDFMAKLNGHYAKHKWKVPADAPPWRQAAKIIRDSIYESHPHLPKLH